jgi:hypothetical protein
MFTKEGKFIERKQIFTARKNIKNKKIIMEIETEK